jgi:two-component system nitrate/nitrite response regulator NarL
MVVGAQPLLAERLRILSRTYPDFEVVGEVVAGSLALTMAARLDPHVVFIDEHLPDADSLNVCDRIHRVFGEAALILVSETMTDSIRLLAVEAGACGLIHPLAPDEDLVLTILRAAEGELLITREVILRLFRHERDLRHQSLGRGPDPHSEPTWCPRRESNPRP